MLETYLVYALVGAVVLFALWLLVRHIVHWTKILRFRSLLPYSDIQGDVENMSQFFGKHDVNRFMYTYFTEDGNLQRALERKKTEGVKKP